MIRIVEIPVLYTKNVCLELVLRRCASKSEMYSNVSAWLGGYERPIVLCVQ